MNYLHPPALELSKPYMIRNSLVQWLCHEYMYVYVGRSTFLIFLFLQFLDFWKASTEFQALSVFLNAKQIVGIFFLFLSSSCSFFLVFVVFDC